MPGKASRLALLALFLPLAATPAVAQSQSRVPADCRTTLADHEGAAAAGPSNPACSAPRETRFYGGWLAHAIMLVDLSPRHSRLRPIRVSATNGLERRVGTGLAAERRHPLAFTVPAAFR
jgi:hypothetical protein